MSVIINLLKLKEYIETNEIAYQVSNELMEVSNDENPECRKSLLNLLSHASSISVYKKGKNFIHEAFKDIDNWSTNDDILIHIGNIEVVLCISRTMAIETALIQE